MSGLPILAVKIGDRLDGVLARIGFAKSKREARYLIEAGAVRLGPVTMESST